MTARLSTHVLDTTVGLPAAGVDVILEDVATGRVLGRARTDEDGRVTRLNDEVLPDGDVRLVLDLAEHWAPDHRVLYPTIAVHARLDPTREHYHLPVLVSPYSYTTYLGS